MIINIRKSVWCILGILSLYASSLTANQTIGEGGRFLSRLSLKHREHKGVGYDQGYSTASLFLCPRTRQIGLPFLDARLHVFNNSDLASNIGIGARYSDSNETYLFGLNAYYDYRNTHSLESHQASVGMEILSRRVDVRFNGYYPFAGKYQDDPILFSRFRGHSLFVKQRVRYALPCAEADLGFTLPDPFDEIGLYLGLGYYYLFKQEGFNRNAGNVSGGRVRLTASPTDYISFGAEYTYDKLFGSRANGFIALNIPLGAVNSWKRKGSYVQTPWIQVKTQDVVRNEIIPVARKQHQFTHLNSDGKPLYFVFVDNGKLGIDGIGSGEGSFEAPYTTLGLGSDNASPGDVVYVFFGDGTASGYDQGFEFKSNQILTSSGVDLTLNGILIPALTPGSFPLITNYEGPVVQASYVGSATVSGFRIEAVEGHAVESVGSSLALKNSSVVAVDAFSALKSVDSIGVSVILDNDFYGSGGPAVIDIRGSQGIYKVSGNSILAQEGQNGIQLENPNGSTYITDNNFQSMDPSGVAINYRLFQGSVGSHQCSGNDLAVGFYEAVHIEGDSQIEANFNIDSNNFSSETLVSGINCVSNFLKSHLSIKNNTIQTSQTCIDISDFGVATTEVDISHNRLFSYSGSSVITSDIEGKATMHIENNIVKYAKNLSGDFSGITCNFKNLERQESRVVISNNHIDMNSKNEGVFIENSNQSNLLVTLDGNAVVSSSNKGIAITNKSSETLYLDMANNKEVNGFTFDNLGKGTFEITPKEGFLEEHNNPRGFYTFKGIKPKESLEEAILE